VRFIKRQGNHIADSTIIDVIGVGIGPANLSLAALLADDELASDRRLSARFFDSRGQFEWHRGQLLPRSRMQSSIIRDLVSLVNPRSRFSFLCFLKAHSRLLQFLNTGIWFTTREEFTQYMTWVVSQLPSLSFGHLVEQIRFSGKDQLFEVDVSRGGTADTCRTRNVVLGTGYQLARICSTTYSSTYLHASSLLSTRPDFGNSAVVVIGGGQSAAEAIQYILDGDRVPRKLVWIARQWTIPPLNTGNFARELFTPAFAQSHFLYTPSARASVAMESRGAESGISPALLEQVYQSLYHHKHVSGTPIELQVLPGTRVERIKKIHDGYTVASTRLCNGQQVLHDADFVVSGVGFGLPRLPPIFVDGVPLEVRLADMARRDYSLNWGGPPNRNIFVQSMATESHGISDLAFTMIAHRSATIANALIGSGTFPVDDGDVIATW